MKGAPGGLASVRPPHGGCQVVSINGTRGGGPTSEVCWGKKRGDALGPGHSPQGRPVELSFLLLL